MPVTRAESTLASVKFSRRKPPLTRPSIAVAEATTSTKSGRPFGNDASRITNTLRPEPGLKRVEKRSSTARVSSVSFVGTPTLRAGLDVPLAGVKRGVRCREPVALANRGHHRACVSPTRQPQTQEPRLHALSHATVRRQHGQDLGPASSPRTLRVSRRPVATSRARPSSCDGTASSIALGARRGVRSFARVESVECEQARCERQTSLALVGEVSQDPPRVRGDVPSTRVKPPSDHRIPT